MYRFFFKTAETKYWPLPINSLNIFTDEPNIDQTFTNIDCHFNYGCIKVCSLTEAVKLTIQTKMNFIQGVRICALLLKSKPYFLLILGSVILLSWMHFKTNALNGKEALLWILVKTLNFQISKVTDPFATKLRPFFLRLMQGTASRFRKIWQCVDFGN